MAYLYNGTLIRAGKAWTDASGVQHPKTWMRWNDETKSLRGLVWQDDPKKVDGRFWFSEGIPRDFDELKASKVAQIKQQAGTALADTDWMIVKAVELGTTTDAEVLAARAAIRSASNDYETEIMNAGDMDELITAWDKDWLNVGN